MVNIIPQDRPMEAPSQISFSWMAATMRMMERRIKKLEHTLSRRPPRKISLEKLIVHQEVENVMKKNVTTPMIHVEEELFVQTYQEEIFEQMFESTQPTIIQKAEGGDIICANDGMGGGGMFSNTNGKGGHGIIGGMGGGGGDGGTTGLDGSDIYSGIGDDGMYSGTCGTDGHDILSGTDDGLDGGTLHSGMDRSNLLNDTDDGMDGCDSLHGMNDGVDMPQMPINKEELLDMLTCGDCLWSAIGQELQQQSEQMHNIGSLAFLQTLADITIRTAIQGNKPTSKASLRRIGKLVASILVPMWIESDLSIGSKKEYEDLADKFTRLTLERLTL